MAKRKIRAVAVVKDVRAGMSDSELQQKYWLAPDALQYVLQRALDAGLITHIEIFERKTLSESDVMRAFVAPDDTVLRCRVCGNILPDEDRECPYCERLTADLRDVLVTQPSEEEMESSITPANDTTGFAHISARGSANVVSLHAASFRKGGTRIVAEDEFWPEDRVVVAPELPDAVEVSSSAAEVEIRENSRRKALLKAASRGLLDSVRALLNRGVDVNCRSKSGNTPLMRAAFKGQLEVMKVLLDRGADINIMNYQGNSALLFACLACHEDVLEMLLDHGADPRPGNIEGDTPLIVCCHEDRTDIVQSLLRKGAVVNRANNKGDTPLMKASEKGHESVVKLLIDAGAAADVKNRYGNTALMKAAFNGHTGVVGLLCQRGADVNLTNSYGNTALMKACFKGLFPVAEILLESGADIKAADKDGKTAVMRAANSGNQQLCDLLMFHSRKGESGFQAKSRS